MTVFKAFLKVLKSCKIPIILYTLCLVLFSVFFVETNDSSTNFVASKPDVLIVNYDEEIGITKGLIDYIKQNSNIIELKNDENVIRDALFYRDINYIIYIPNHFRTNFLLGKHPQIKIQSTGDYQASFAEMMLERYIKVASIYRVSFDNEEEIVKQVQDVLSKTVKIEMTSKLNTNQLSRVSFYYNFANYSILAGCVYVICLVLSSFKEKNIQKRTIISSTNYRKYNQILLLSNSLFAFILWGIYVLLSFILLGNIMFTIHGLIYIMNSFVFTFCALTIAFLIGNLVSSKEAINGIVNVVALGSSFLCGSFVPMEWLPNSVLKIAQILPSYWYIKTNEVVKTLEVIDFASLKPIIIHLFILILFAIGFMILTNLISMKKQKID